MLNKYLLDEGIYRQHVTFSMYFHIYCCGFFCFLAVLGIELRDSLLQAVYHLTHTYSLFAFIVANTGSHIYSSGCPGLQSSYRYDRHVLKHALVLTEMGSQELLASAGPEL
jgi:hypothetical protein